MAKPTRAQLRLENKLAGLTREEAYALGKEEGGHLTRAELQGITQEMIKTEAYRWCRARFFHALVGAWKQGKLQEVFDELLDEKSWDRVLDGARDPQEMTDNLINEVGNRLADTGWLT